MNSSIRLRLTLWYAVVLAITLGMASLFVYGQLARNHYERLEARLETALRVIESSLAHEIDEHGGREEGENSFQFVLRTIHPLTFPDLELAVMIGKKKVGSKPESGGIGLREEVLAEAVKRSEGENSKAVVWSAAGWRYMSLRAPVAGNDYTFVTGGSERRADAEVRALERAFLFGMPIPLLLAAAGGWWLMRKSFAPIAAMSETADAISAESLGQRLAIANPGDELGRLGRSFNRLLDRLEASFEVQRRFMSDASHELRTPVSIARTAAQVTLEREQRSEEEYREALGMIERQLQRMGRLVEDMFLLALADAGALELRKERFYLEEVIGESVAAARLLGAKRGIQIEAGEWEEMPCHADVARLRQAIMILLDNAIKYSPTGSTVRVKVWCEGKFIVVEVADEGRGVEEQDRERIFERFYRPDDSRARGSGDAGGAGLGLAIARRIVEAHGGRLELMEAPPTGSVFRIKIPG